ncbi:hypothetical protein FNW25_11540 [Flavobacterium franklandianum]|uniref:hypothetical protein n=1 Tax=Flavobacterium franklandianum TaxID=2594430 RepID=UPI00117AF408|nr:hypothetical protein [Flavobacterium franklandianum]TRX24378.1 hypothetical protein FNW25_11540 [Flavobacterium franklandianum]
MEQHKLETQFKEKLNSREIKPTEMAWDKLDSMLSTADSTDSEQALQKPKSKFSWLYIAASFIGFLLITTIFFNQKENAIDIKKNTVLTDNTSQKESSKTEIKSIKTEPNFSKTILKSETKPLVQTQKNTKSNVENPTFKTQENAVAEIQLNNLNLQIEENKNVIHENIDNLLASAEKTQKSELKTSTLKINSTDLLNQVDGELQVSFREKALNTITQKYKEAKEALVNRNNQ